jgi:chorismate mutase
VQSRGHFPLALAPLYRKGKPNGLASRQKSRNKAAFWPPSGEHRVSDETLQRYRDSIDNIDAAIIYMLAERFKITQDVGRYKATIGLPAADPMREKRQIQRLRRLATDAKLDPEFSEKFLRFIIDEVIRHHHTIKDSQAA